MRLGLGLSLTGMPAGGGAPYDAVTALGSDLLEGWEAWRAGTVTQAGGLVSAWAGIKTGASAAQSSAGLKPSYSATGLNGGPALAFDGTDDVLELATPPFSTGSAAGEIWALVDSTALAADTATRVIGGYGGNGTVSRSRYAARRVVSGASRGGAGVGNGTTGVVANNETVVFEGRHLIRIQIGTTSTGVSIDGGAAVSTSATPSTLASVLRIGANPDNTAAANFFKGFIAAIYFTAALSTEKAAGLTAALKQRGGLV